ncbi:hypothetical protein [Pseudomonas sp.]|uniref:hypothetical protein n=1 Tax=Pseudomonas sp. TaxID=306 RepID=UPI0028A58366|nr:hypothetical protein [Pseudomonas sp.]
MRHALIALLWGLGLAGAACAETRGGVWIYQPDGGSYRVERPAAGYRYDPRSPYPQYRQYPQNLPPRYQVPSSPRDYGRSWERERRQGMDHHRRDHRWPRVIDRQQQRDHRPHHVDPSRQWRHDARRFDRAPLPRQYRERRGFERR